MSKKEVKQEQETLIDDPTKGTEPIVPNQGKPQSIIIEGVEYKFHRLHYKEIFAMSRIMSRVGSELLESMFTAPNVSDFIIALSLAMGYAEAEVLQILGRFLGVNPKLFDDPEKFPIDSIFDVIEALNDSVDLKAFFTKALKIGTMTTKT